VGQQTPGFPMGGSAGGAPPPPPASFAHTWYGPIADSVNPDGRDYGAQPPTGAQPGQYRSIWDNAFRQGTVAPSGTNRALPYIYRPLPTNPDGSPVRPNDGDARSAQQYREEYDRWRLAEQAKYPPQMFAEPLQSVTSTLPPSSSTPTTLPSYRAYEPGNLWGNAFTQLLGLSGYSPNSIPTPFGSAQIHGAPQQPSAIPPQSNPFGTISSTITPSPVYGQSDIEQAYNSAIATGHQAAFGNPLAWRGQQGISAGSPAYQNALGMEKAGGMGQAIAGAENQRLQDTVANVSQMLNQQGLRTADAAGQLGSLAGLAGLNQGYAGQSAENLLAALGAGMSGANAQNRMGLEDYISSAQNALQGQNLRFADALGWAGNQAGMAGLNQAYGASSLQSLLDALGAGMSGVNAQNRMGLEDSQWNAQNLLGQQNLRLAEALGLTGSRANLAGLNQGYGASSLQSLLDALGAGMTGVNSANRMGLEDSQWGAQQRLALQNLRIAEALGLTGSQANLAGLNQGYGASANQNLLAALLAQMSGTGTQLGQGLEDAQWWQRYGLNSRLGNMNNTMSWVDTLNRLFNVMG